MKTKVFLFTILLSTVMICSIPSISKASSSDADKQKFKADEQSLKKVVF